MKYSEGSYRRPKGSKGLWVSELVELKVEDARKQEEWHEKETDKLSASEKWKGWWKSTLYRWSKKDGWGVGQKAQCIWETRSLEEGYST